ncbi:MAG: type III-A CRISPR-associated RAMP protein Csm4 [Bacteroidia bacterium]
MKAEFTAVKLHFEGPLHLARGRSDYETAQDMLHSDTLMAAIMACGIQLLGEDVVNEGFMQSFRLSSAYPFCGEEYFFPKPQSPFPFAFEAMPEAKVPKARKKISFIGKSYFEQLLVGGQQENTVPPAHIHSSGKFLSARVPANESIMVRETQQRVTVPHWGTEAEPTPFYLDRLYFGENAGLFFLTDASGQTLKQLRSILRLLGDNGLGTDRHVGNGHFDCEFVEGFSISLPKDAKSQLCLSLYCPLKEELSPEMLKDSAFQLIKRGGYMASPADPSHRTYRKRSVYMFTEGSVFPARPLTGKYVDLAPLPESGANILPHGPVSHPVWRDGRSLFLPIHIYQPKGS